MDSLFCSLEGRSFLNFLNTLAKKLFYDDLSITYEYITENLFATVDLEGAEIRAQILSFEKVISK
jgi:hypothetical protein